MFNIRLHLGADSALLLESSRTGAAVLSLCAQRDRNSFRRQQHNASASLLIETDSSIERSPPAGVNALIYTLSCLRLRDARHPASSLDDYMSAPGMFGTWTDF